MIIFCIIIAVIIALIVLCRMWIKKRRSTCSKCKTKYKYPDNIRFAVSGLKWEKATREEKKGDYTYEITYKKYYRDLRVTCICGNCGEMKLFEKRIDLWRSDSNHSQSSAEELQLLQQKTAALFNRDVFGSMGYRKIDFEVDE